MDLCRPTRPLEELFDTATDPDNIHNLAAVASVAPCWMRSRLHEWLRETRDVGFLTEDDLAASTGGVPPYCWAMATAGANSGRCRPCRPAGGVPEADRAAGRSESRVALLGRIPGTAREPSGPRPPGMLEALDNPSVSVLIEAAAAFGIAGRPPTAACGPGRRARKPGRSGSGPRRAGRWNCWARRPVQSRPRCTRLPYRAESACRRRRQHSFPLAGGPGEVGRTAAPSPSGRGAGGEGAERARQALFCSAPR